MASSPCSHDPSDVEEIVRKSWKLLEAQCSSIEAQCRPLTDRPYGWQVVRLFVSSTFADLHAEREVLVKKVFPDLKEFCEERHLHLVECDLRWGVPKDSTTRTILCTCLDEIQICHDETNGKGFFLNMLSERYGWIPSEDDVPSDIASKYQWIPGFSITHMEIVNGAYRTRNPNAVFLLKDSSFLDTLAEEFRESFVDTEPLAVAQLKELKRSLRKRFPNQVLDYKCEVEGVKNNKVTMKGLDDFATMVTNFFKSAIAKQYPVAMRDQTPEEIENDNHNTFFEQRGCLVYGRDELVQMMLKFATDQKVAESGLIKSRSSPTEDKKVGGLGYKSIKTPPLVIMAEPGQGKSALMGKCAHEAKKAGLNVFYHFVGCSSLSSDPANLLLRLSEAIAKPNDKRLEEMKTDFKYGRALRDLLAMLKEFGKSKQQLLVIVDAINQLIHSTDFLKWIPTKSYGSLRFIISTTREPATLSSLDCASPEAYQIDLPNLPESARTQLVKNYFGIYNKSLDSEQLSLLTSSQGAQNVLWLSLACEELRVFGVFERLTDRIKTLPCTLEELLAEIIRRMITEDDTGFVEQILCLLECSRQGLMEIDLRLILGDLDSKTPAPMLLWTQARRTLKTFLRKSGRVGQIEQLNLFHSSIKQTVRKELLSDQNKCKSIHIKLADFFQYHCSTDELAIAELPYQLRQAGEIRRLVQFLMHDARRNNMDAFTVAKQLKDFRCKGDCQPGPTSFPMKLCQSCKDAEGGISSAVVDRPNRDCCVLCSNEV
ncbi:telomerase protein component 1-like, partial [Anneissia japonica]|uniref:telomerase protein component 1-like n=1 Tax=Anneissia japonica TaxID=1529436 RepID=UPI0014256C12